jgi:hypothetical protein
MPSAAHFGGRKNAPRNAKTAGENAIEFGLFYIAVTWRAEERPPLLARPAPLGENHTAFVGRAAKRAGKFEGFIAFGSGSHLTRKFKRIGGCDVMVQPVTLG